MLLPHTPVSLLLLRIPLRPVSFAGSSALKLVLIIFPHLTQECVLPPSSSPIPPSQEVWGPQGADHLGIILKCFSAPLVSVASKRGLMTSKWQCPEPNKVGPPLCQTQKAALGQMSPVSLQPQQEALQ